jgi:hypothetical protein
MEGWFPFVPNTIRVPYSYTGEFLITSYWFVYQACCAPREFKHFFVIVSDDVTLPFRLVRSLEYFGGQASPLDYQQNNAGPSDMLIEEWSLEKRYPQNRDPDRRVDYPVQAIVLPNNLSAVEDAVIPDQQVSLDPEEQSQRKDEDNRALMGSPSQKKQEDRDTGSRDESTGREGLDHISIIVRDL